MTDLHGPDDRPIPRDPESGKLNPDGIVPPANVHKQEGDVSDGIPDDKEHEPVIQYSIPLYLLRLRPQTAKKNKAVVTEFAQKLPSGERVYIKIRHYFTTEADAQKHYSHNQMQMQSLSRSIEDWKLKNGNVVPEDERPEALPREEDIDPIDGPKEE